MIRCIAWKKASLGVILHPYQSPSKGPSNAERWADASKRGQHLAGDLQVYMNINLPPNILLCLYSAICKLARKTYTHYFDSILRSTTERKSKGSLIFIFYKLWQVPTCLLANFYPSPELHPGKSRKYSLWVRKLFNHTNGAPQGTKCKPIMSHLIAKRGRLH